MKAEWQAEKERIKGADEVRERLAEAHRELERATREGDLERAAQLRHGEIPELERRLEEAAGRRGRRQRSPARLLQGARRQRRRRGDRRALDRHPGQPHRGVRDGQARPSGGAAARARRRPGRGGQRGRERDPPLTRRAAGPRPPDRLVPLRSARPASARPSSRARSPSSCSTARTRWSASTCRVRGEAHRLAAGRRAARLRRLRGGRPAHRGRAPAPLQRRAARRAREGPPRRLQHAAPGARRRAPDRRPGPHRGLQEHGADHDLQRRLGQPATTARPCARRASSRSSSTASTTSSSSIRLSREQIGEIVDLQVARLVTRVRERGIEVELIERGAHAARQPRLRPDLRRAPAQARDPEAARRPARDRPARGPLRGGRHDPRRRRRRRAGAGARRAAGAGFSLTAGRSRRRASGCPRGSGSSACPWCSRAACRTAASSARSRA